MCDEYTYISKYVHLDIRCTSGVASYGKGGGGYLIAQHSRRREDSNFVDNCWHLCAQWCIADGSKLCVWQNPFCSEISSKRFLLLGKNLKQEKMCCHLKWLDFCRLSFLQQCLLWHFWLWSFQGRDTKLDRFLAKNQLYSNEITKFWELE